MRDAQTNLGTQLSQLKDEIRAMSKTVVEIKQKKQGVGALQTQLDAVLRLAERTSTNVAKAIKII
jgi:TolA-binding protein